MMKDAGDIANLVQARAAKAREHLAMLDAYLVEAHRQWERDPEAVVGRGFFELWENVRRPRAFRLDAASIEVGGQTFKLIGGKNVKRIAQIGWDAEEACAALVVDGPEARQTFHFVFEDGNSRVTEAPPYLKAEETVTFGERLEFIYDVIRWCREQRPTLDVRKIGKADYDTAVRELADYYEKRVLSVMRRLRLRDVRKLVDRATRDMAADELSDQLMLPLDGSYAVGSSGISEIPGTDPHVPYPFCLHSRTPWTVSRELAILQAAAEIRMKLETTFSLSLEQAEILHQSPDHTLTLRVPLPLDAPIREGDRLQVRCRGESNFRAEFRVDVHEGPFMIARLGRLAKGDETDLGRFCVLPMRSPYRFIAGELAALQNDYQQDAGKLSAVQEAVLGIREFTLPQFSAAPMGIGELDKSQSCAAFNAVASGSQVVLIQGPPGTGKTHVLEKVIRDFVSRGLRILMTAPSNTAVDNLCRRIGDLPVLRLGNQQRSIAADLQETQWIGCPEAIQLFKQKRDKIGRGSVYAGTHVGILRNELVQADQEKNGDYDVVVFDEAGMSSLDEFLLCARYGKRAVLFGDHCQLPPFPMSREVAELLDQRLGPLNGAQWAAVGKSALEWLGTERGVPIHLLNASYRCQNPRLMRFASILFYDARVRASREADYYRLAFHERQQRYPPSTLRFYRTSRLPAALREERLVCEGSSPGLENNVEAQLAVRLIFQLREQYALREISVISPYRRQIRLIRHLVKDRLAERGETPEAEKDWIFFIYSRIATVDSFQGGESDVVIISYVRSNAENRIGFVDDANRVNVAHTRSRREMHVIGDLDCLKRGARTRIFDRMERAIRRDGEIVDVALSDLEEARENERAME